MPGGKTKKQAWGLVWRFAYEENYLELLLKTAQFDTSGRQSAERQTPTLEREEEEMIKGKIALPN